MQRLATLSHQLAVGVLASRVDFDLLQRVTLDTSPGVDTESARVCLSCPAPLTIPRGPAVIYGQRGGSRTDRRSGWTARMAHEVAYAVQYRPRWIITAVAAGALRQRQHGPVMINTFEPNRQDRREVYIYIYISVK